LQDPALADRAPSAQARLVIVALDVAYHPDHAVVGVVGFEAWTDAHAGLERALRVEGPPAEYEPGAFYRRERPCLLAALAGLPEPPEVVVVDGYVFVGPGRPGLGAWLAAALAETGSAPIVVGVAKSGFSGATHALPVHRGDSRRPLYVDAQGVALETAAAWLRSMHGPHRLPSLLRRVDQLTRGLGPPAGP
jgi:deoxyribonuclease V